MGKETILDDYDGAWKETVEIYFRSFLELCFPAVAKEVDWRVAPEFMDQELQAVVRDAKIGKLRVDKLVKVRGMDGKESVVFLHLEVQEQTEDAIGKRMFDYNQRIGSKFGLPVVSLLFLTGQGWQKKKTIYESSFWGCKVRFEYPVCRMEDFGGIAELVALKNPVGVVMAAHWAAQRTKQAERERYSWKKKLLIGLYEKGYEKKQMLELFRLVDWLLRMSQEIEVEFQREIEEYEKKENKDMAYVTSWERIGEEKGIALGEKKGETKGKKSAVLEVLASRFRRVPDGLKDAVMEIQSTTKLRALLRKAAVCQSIEDFAEGL